MATLRNCSTCPLFRTAVAPTKVTKIMVINVVKCSIALTSNDTALGEKSWKVADARLVLEDGSVWKAKSFGASGTQIGEVDFNTSLTGEHGMNNGYLTMFSSLYNSIHTRKRKSECKVF